MMQATIDGTPVDAAPPVAPPKPFSFKLAWLVPGIAVGVLALFGIMGALSNGIGTTAPVTPLSAFGPVVSIEPTFHPGASASRPPSDVLGNLFMPKATVVVGPVHTSGDVTSYDGAMSYTSTKSQGFLVSFYRAQLAHAGWTVLSDGPAPRAPGSLLVTVQRTGTDGNTWDGGVTIAPTTFSSGVSGQGAALQQTAFTIRVFQTG